MKKVKQILVPVDFSDHSKEALRFATNTAHQMSMGLIVLHVVHDPLNAPGYYIPKGHKKVLKKIKDLAKDRLHLFMKSFVKDCPQIKQLIQCETKLVSGLPVTRILEIVKKHNPYMVVMGSEGRTGLANLMLGSKAEQLTRLCPNPVTIVKAPEKRYKNE